MSKQTRYFVMTAGAVLAVGLTTGLVASYLGLPVVFSRAAGPDELQYVPADASVVAYANVRDVMTSSFREHVRKLEPDSTARDDFKQKTGVDIEQDIQSVVAAMIPGAEGQPSGQNGVLVLARGRFDQARLEAMALEHGGQVHEYEGKRLLTHIADQGEPSMAMGFLDVDLVAFGSYTAVTKSIDASAGNNIVSNTELMRQVNELDDSNAWAVGRFDSLVRTGELPTEFQAHIPAIHWFSAAGHINGGVRGVFRAEARDEEAARNLRDMIQGFVALARLQAGSRPEVKGVVDSLQLSGDGKHVALSFALPAELFDALQLMNRHRQTPGQPQDR
jgi:hypothetical protein